MNVIETEELVQNRITAVDELVTKYTEEEPPNTHYDLADLKGGKPIGLFEKGCEYSSCLLHPRETYNFMRVSIYLYYSILYQ